MRYISILFVNRPNITSCLIATIHGGYPVQSIAGKNILCRYGNRIHRWFFYLVFGSLVAIEIDCQHFLGIFRCCIALRNSIKNTLGNNRVIKQTSHANFIVNNDFICSLQIRIKKYDPTRISISACLQNANLYLSARTSSKKSAKSKGKPKQQYQ